MHYAHSTANVDRSDWQPLPEHLLAVADAAGVRAEKFGAARAAWLAGLAHDLGKYAQAFQHYIAKCGPSPDHSTAGAKAILEIPLEKFDRLVAEAVATCVASHHAGLLDRRGLNASLEDRLAKTLPPLDPAWSSEVSLEAGSLLPEGFAWHPDTRRRAFQLSFLGRMVFSCLVDADFLDTEAFYARVERRAIDRHWRALPDVIDELCDRFERHIAAKHSAAADTDVNRRRRSILTHARAKSALPPGLFTLDVSTGGGKTLTSLGFALDHAKAHGLDRIIYAIPFTSVIEQTAAIFREVLGDDVVLEHHSAIEDELKRERERAGKDKLKLAMENWDAPVVVTTNVQLFESLFAARTSRCRKLHNIARSVIVLDEAQTIPLHVLRPSVAALDELARNYGASVLVCTATQPALGVPKEKGGAGLVGGLDLKPERELAPDPGALHAAFRRVTLRIAGEMSDDALIAELAETTQGLVIVNSRKHALDLYRAARAAGLGGLIHLTTRQTATDRKAILDEVRRRLAASEPCRLIATSLVEAGVDLDFPKGWRAEAGLEQIIQAAGRVNREGKRPVEESVVTVFKPVEAKAPPELAQFAAATQRMQGRHPDLFTPAAVRAYFEEVYWQKSEALDRNQVLAAFRATMQSTDFAYRSVADNFHLVESGMVPVIVPHDVNSEDLVKKLCFDRAPSGLLARGLQAYTVQVPPRARQLLIDCGKAAFEAKELRGDQFAVLSARDLYSPEIGLVWEDADYISTEALVI